MISINNYLDTILSDFVSYLDEGHKLCNLKSVNFDRGQVPDYKDVHVQQYYLLRYAYAYAFEYKLMYNKLFETYSYQREIAVTSIGCGTMLDYWALVRVLEQRGKGGMSVYYTGIDQINWQYQVTQRQRDEVIFVQNDVLAEFTQYNSLDSDVYFFPKSISEFSDADFKNFCHMFANKYIKQNQVHIMISVRSDQENMAQDFQNAELLKNAIIRNGFRVISDGSWCATKPEEMIYKTDSDFRHPSNIIEYLKELNTCCSHYQINCTHCETDCESRLTRWPILKQGQVHFLTFTFERK